MSSTLVIGGGAGSTTASGAPLTADQEALLKRDYVIVNRLSNNLETAQGKIGKVADNNTLPGLVYRPQPMQKVGDDVFCINYYGKPCLLTPTTSGPWTFKKEYQAPYAAAATTNEAIGHGYGGVIDVPNNRMAVCSWAYHCVRQYDLDGNLQFTIGIPRSAGHQSVGKLYYPARCFYTPNGELAVMSYYGYGDGCNNHGHISLYDAATGAFIATRSGCTETRSTVVESGGLYRPIDCVADGNLLYVSVYGRSKVAVLDMSALDPDGFWPVVDIIYMPPSVPYGSSNSTTAALWGVTLLSDGTLAVMSHRNSAVYGIDPATHEHKWTIDLPSEGYQGDCRRLLELEPGYLVLGNTSLTMLQVVAVPGSAALTEQYDVPVIPAGWEIYHKPEGFDELTGEMTFDSVRSSSAETLALAIREI